MDAEEYGKLVKTLYKASAKEPQIIKVPPMRFAMIDGSGDPNTSKEFEAAVQALYSLSYGIKFLPKKGAPPQGYFEYGVSALEGLWDMPEGVEYTLGNKDKFIWTLMIAQPPFVTQALFEQVRAMQREKKGVEAMGRLRLEYYEEGLCCQMMHIGPYDDEPATFALMMEYAEEKGLLREKKGHHEIYMSDARRTSPEKQKTILRFKAAQRI